MKIWLGLISLVVGIAMVFGSFTGAQASSLKTISAKALSDHECDDSEWHFVITQVESEGQAPASIFVTWANGANEDVPLDAFTGGVAHYATTSNLGSPVTGASTQIYEEWGGQFNLSHGPCFDPDPTPTETVEVPTNTPTLVVFTLTPTTVPSDTPTATATSTTVVVTLTPTGELTVTPTGEGTTTPTSTLIVTLTSTNTPTLVVFTATPTPTSLNTPTVTSTSTIVVTLTPTGEITVTPTGEGTPTPTSTLVVTLTPTDEVEVTVTPKPPETGFVQGDMDLGFLRFPGIGLLILGVALVWPRRKS